jgi:hypothetical protein
VDETRLGELCANLAYHPTIFAGDDGLVEIARLTNADMVLVAVVGTGGLRPALAAIEAGKDPRGGEQGNPGDGGRSGDGSRGGKGRPGFAGRQRAQRDLSVFGRETSNVQR